MEGSNSMPTEQNSQSEHNAQELIQTAHNEITPAANGQANEQEQIQDGGQEVSQSATSAPSSPNKQGLTSEAWKHFRREKIEGKWKAICKYCDKKLGGDTKQGTKGLHDHIRICPIRTIRGPKQSILKTVTQSTGSGGGATDSLLLGNFSFSQERARRELTSWVVEDNHPISFVEQNGFHRFMAECQPLFKFYSRNTLRSDILKMYEEEKTKILKLLHRNSSRIAITTDMWSSDCQNKGYMSITAHFIDDDWSLQSRLVRFAYVPTPHTAEALSEVLVNSLYDLNIDRKLSTLTVDNCSTNDAMIHLIIDKVSPSYFIKRGEFFHMRCCAHIINLIVKDGMNAIYDCIEKIRESVAFWVATQRRAEKFAESCKQLNINYRKKLSLDCRTRWNSTYLMLASALPYKEVFARLRQRESDYKFVPSDDDWKMANELIDKLEVFYAVTELFSGTQYPTTKVFFPKVCEMRLALNEWMLSPNDVVQRMATKMSSKFEKYWSQINDVMAVGAILDPRYKLKLLKFFFPKLYGAQSEYQLNKVKKMMEELVCEYQLKSKGRKRVQNDVVGSSGTLNAENEEGPSKKTKFSSIYLQFVEDTSEDCVVKTELDYYLEESVMIDKINLEKFDILGYWKNIGVKYPTLQQIARDFLAIPISTVASESAFSIGGRTIHPHRSSLEEDLVEALLCTQNWIHFAGKSRGKIPSLA